MSRILSNKALSLIELIIATSLMTIVIVGLYSINNIIRVNNQDYSQRYILRGQTQTTLTHILNNVALAYGSLNADDEPILSGVVADGAANSSYSCIHQLANNNIISSPADIWLCYQWYPSGDVNYPNRINWCTEAYVAGNDPRGAQSCSAAGAAVTYLGSAFEAPAITFSFNPRLLVNVTIKNCLDNTAASCNAGGAQGVSSDPANNPEVMITGSTTPLQTSSG